MPPELDESAKGRDVSGGAGEWFLGDADDPAARDRDQIRGTDAENGVGSARRRPDLIQAHQIFVEEGLDLFGMPDRRHAADGEAGPLTHEFRFGRTDGLQGELGKFSLINSVAPARDHEHRPTGLQTSKDEGLRNLVDPAADDLRRLGGGSRVRRQLNDPDRNSQGGQGLLDTLSAGGKGRLDDRRTRPKTRKLLGAHAGLGLGFPPAGGLRRTPGFQPVKELPQLDVDRVVSRKKRQRRLLAVADLFL